MVPFVAIWLKHTKFCIDDFSFALFPTYFDWFECHWLCVSLFSVLSYLDGLCCDLLADDVFLFSEFTYLNGFFLLCFLNSHAIQDHFTHTSYCIQCLHSTPLFAKSEITTSFTSRREYWIFTYFLLEKMTTFSIFLLLFGLCTSVTVFFPTSLFHLFKSYPVFSCRYFNHLSYHFAFHMRKMNIFIHNSMVL